MNRREQTRSEWHRSWDTRRRAEGHNRCASVTPLAHDGSMASGLLVLKDNRWALKDAAEQIMASAYGDD